MGPPMTGDALERQIFRILAGTDITLASAESCTGGLIAYRITTVAGSSEYFLGGVVAYANDLKTRLLGVSADTIRTDGAVSSACAREMAEGVRTLTGATIGVSTTGIAGPGGATATKPVGLIYIACSTPNGTRVEEVRWRGDRAQHMVDAAEFGLRMVIDAATEASAASVGADPDI